MSGKERAGPVFYDELEMNTYDDPNGGLLHVDYARSLHVITRNIRQNGRGINAELDFLCPTDTPNDRTSFSTSKTTRNDNALP